MSGYASGDCSVFPLAVTICSPLRWRLSTIWLCRTMTTLLNLCRMFVNP